MRRLRIFRHQAHEGPGYLAEVLEREAIPFEVVAVDRGEPVPAGVDDVGGLVFMGGPMSVNDPLRWVADEVELIRRAVGQEVPVLGHCLGGQLLAKALGGVVARAPAPEIGWAPVARVRGAMASPWLERLPECFEVFHWHGEAFTVPEGGELLLASEACPSQAFAVGGALGLQFHVEMTAAMVREWAARSAGALDDPAPTVQSAAAMSERLDERVAALHEVADRIYAAWLGLVRERG